MNGQFIVSSAVPPRSKPGPGKAAHLEKSQPRAPDYGMVEVDFLLSKAVTP